MAAPTEADARLMKHDTVARSKGRVQDVALAIPLRRGVVFRGVCGVVLRGGGGSSTPAAGGIRIRPDQTGIRPDLPKFKFPFIDTLGSYFLWQT